MARKRARVRTRTAKIKAVRRVRRELSALERNILWSFALGSRNTHDIANSLDLSRDRAEEEVTNLRETGYLMQNGGFIKGIELTAQGYEVLGSPGIKLDSKITTDSLKSGSHARLIVTARNTGNAPITDAVVRIVAPKFLTISRFGSEYERDEERAIVEFPLTHLNPGENQTLEFDLHGNLTSGTTESRYKVMVNALTGGAVTDKKELNLTLLA